MNEDRRKEVIKGKRREGGVGEMRRMRFTFTPRRKQYTHGNF